VRICETWSATVSVSIRKGTRKRIYLRCQRAQILKAVERNVTRRWELILHSGRQYICTGAWSRRLPGRQTSEASAISGASLLPLPRHEPEVTISDPLPQCCCGAAAEAQRTYCRSGRLKKQDALTSASDGWLSCAFAAPTSARVNAGVTRRGGRERAPPESGRRAAPLQCQCLRGCALSAPASRQTSSRACAAPQTDLVNRFCS